MNSHDLARVLLAAPNLPVATHAMNHEYLSAADGMSHGPLMVGILESYAGRHILIGNFHRRMLNPPNWHVSEMLRGDVPQE
jgi:hypothetical protein